MIVLPWYLTILTLTYMKIDFRSVIGTISIKKHQRLYQEMHQSPEENQSL
jgi:hypothetical protein